MTFDGIIGNESVVTALKEMAASGRIPHAMMLYENDGGGAMPLVLAFLDAVYGHDRKVARLIHPDIHYVYPVARGTRVDEKQENLRASLFLDYWRELMVENPYATETEVSAAFGIEGKQAIINNAEAREILETIYLSSVEGGYKTVVVYLPEKMNASAANRLLKAIEEPPEKTLFLMITHAPEKVIQTITSRCQAFRVFPLDRTGIVSVLTGRFGASEEDAMQAAAVSGGSIGTALRFLKDQEAWREGARLFERILEALTAGDLLGALSCADVLSESGSREKQKAFCTFAGDCLRKLFLQQQGLSSLAAFSPEEEAFYNRIAPRCKNQFPRTALALMDRAAMLLDRNVNPKIVFTDVIGRMYLMI